MSLFIPAAAPNAVFVFIMTPPDEEEIYLTQRFIVGEWTFLGITWGIPLDYIPKNATPPSIFLYFQSKATLERDFPRAYGTGILYTHGFIGLFSR